MRYHALDMTERNYLPSPSTVESHILALIDTITFSFSTNEWSRKP